MTWEDRCYERIPPTHIASRVMWHVSRIVEQSRPKPKGPPTVMGDDAYARAVRIVRSEDEGQGIPLDEQWE